MLIRIKCVPKAINKHAILYIKPKSPYNGNVFIA